MTAILFLCHVWKTYILQRVFGPEDLKNLSAFFSIMFAESKCSCCLIDVTVGVGYPIVIYFLHFEQLWISIIVFLSFQKEFTLKRGESYIHLWA